MAALPVALSSFVVFASALLNAVGAVGRLAALSVLSSAAVAIGVGPAAYAYARALPNGHGESMLALLIFSTAVSAAAAMALLLRFRDRLVVWLCGPGRWWCASDARRFGAISLSMLAGGLATSGALLVVRGHIAASQGLTVTGQFDAAWNLSMNQVTLVLSSVQTYYLPALSRSRSASERDAHISRVLTVAVVAAAGVIALMALLKPWLLSFLYSDAFRAAASYLRRTLLGDYLKVTSWILSIPILAAADMKMFLAADLLACGVFVAVAAAFASSLTAASAAAVAFVAMYAVHLILCAVYLLRKLHYVPARSAVAAWLGGLVLVIAVSALTWKQT